MEFSVGSFEFSVILLKTQNCKLKTSSCRYHKVLRPLRILGLSKIVDFINSLVLNYINPSKIDLFI